MSDFFKIWKRGSYPQDTSPAPSGSFNVWADGYPLDEFSGIPSLGTENPNLSAQGNNFVDSDVVLWLRFENSLGAEHDSSLYENDLTTVGTPAYNNSFQIESDDCANFDNNWYEAITDADLSTDFPTKDGDTTQQFSVCFWFQPNVAVQYSKIISKWDWYGNKVSWAIQPGDSTYNTIFDWGYGTGQQFETLDTEFNPTNGYWYHYTVIVDGVAQTCKIRIWDDFNQIYVVDETFNAANPLRICDADLVVGSEVGGWNKLQSYVDELVVFKKLLTDEESEYIRKGIYPTGEPTPPEEEAPPSASPVYGVFFEEDFEDGTLDKWDYIGAAAEVVETRYLGMVGNYHGSVGNAGDYIMASVSASDEFYLSFRWLSHSNAGYNNNIVSFYYGGYLFGALSKDANGYLKFRNSTTTLVTTSANLWNQGVTTATCYVVEMYYKHAAVDGRVEVRIDGTTVINFTGNTYVTAGYVNRLRFGYDSTSGLEGNCQIDNIIMAAPDLGWHLSSDDYFPETLPINDDFDDLKDWSYAPDWYDTYATEADAVSGTSCVLINGNDGGMHRNIGSVDGVAFSFWAKEVDSTPFLNPGLAIFKFGNDEGWQVSICIDQTAGYVSVYSVDGRDNGTELIGTTAVAWSTLAWHKISGFIYISPTEGVISIDVDDVNVGSYLGQTQFQASGKITRIVFGPYPTSSYLHGKFDALTLTESTSAGAPVSEPPADPTDLTVTDYTFYSVSLGWTDNATNETGYYVQRKTGAGAFSTIDSIVADSTSYLDTTVSPETTYTYRVVAWNASGTANSNEVEVTTLAYVAPPEISGAYYDDETIVAWYQFESNDFGKELIHGQQLSFSGTPTSATGRSGYSCINLGGTSYGYRDQTALIDYFPAKYDGPRTGTICFWINLNSLVDYAKVISFWDASGGGRGFALTTRDVNGKFAVEIGFSGGAGGVTNEFDFTLDTSTWYHISVSFSLANISSGYTNPLKWIRARIWDNTLGDIVHDETIYSTYGISIADTPNLIIGSEVGGSNKLDAKLDEMVIWCRTLSTTEMDLVRAGAYYKDLPHNIFDSRAVARWQFDPGLSLIDSIGSNTLSNSTDAVSVSSDAPWFEHHSYMSFDGSDRLTIADASLDSGFPLKSDDTTKKMSFCLWQYNEFGSYPASDKFLISKYEAGTNKRSFAFGMYAYDMKFMYGKTDGTAAESFYIQSQGIYSSGTSWTFIGVAIDGVNKFVEIYSFNYEGGGVWTKVTLPLAYEMGVFDSALEIGSRDGSNFWTGRIADVCIFNDTLSEADFWALSQGQYPPENAGVAVYSETQYTELTQYDMVQIQKMSIQGERKLGPDSINISKIAAQVEWQKQLDNAVALYTSRESVEAIVDGKIDVRSGAGIYRLCIQAEVLYGEREIPQEYPGAIIQRGRGYGRYYKMTVQNGVIVLTYRE